MRTPSTSKTHCSLVVRRWLVVWVEFESLLDAVVPLILQPLPYSDLARVESLAIVGVDGLGGGRAVGGVGRDTQVTCAQHPTNVLNLEMHCMWTRRGADTVVAGSALVAKGGCGRHTNSERLTGVLTTIHIQ